MVVTTGLARIAALLAQDSTAFPSHLAIGTDNTATQASDTTMGGEVDRNALGSTSSSGAVVTYKAFFGKTEGNTNTIWEVGLFDDATSGTMIARSILSSSVAKDATKSLTITWTFTFSDT